MTTAAGGEPESTVAARICAYDVTTTNEVSPLVRDELVPDDVLDEIVRTLRRGVDTGGPRGVPDGCGDDGVRMLYFLGVTAAS